MGTRLVTGSGAPTASMVYKLVERADAQGQPQAVEKASAGKASTGWAKRALRSLNGLGRAEAEVISAQTPLSEAGYAGRELQIPLVVDGQPQPGFTGPEGVQRAAQRHRESLQELPAEANRLSTGEPVLPSIMV